MKKHVFIYFAVFQSIIAFSQTDQRYIELDNALNKILSETKIPSFAVAVVNKEKILYAKGFGYRDIEHKKLADANTLYPIGSTTKAFTSAILGQLRDEQHISFDENPRKYLPNLEFYSDELNKNIIIKDLMSHRTGIPMHDGAWDLFNSNSSDTLLKRIKYYKPFTGLRQKWCYNNWMFLVQGNLAEALTDKTWSENVQERFFKPLKMSRSNLNLSDFLQVENRAIGYHQNTKGINEKVDYFPLGGMRAAGSINSSANDMANWLLCWINNGKFDNQQIIPENYIKEATTPTAVADDLHKSLLFALEDNPQQNILTYGYGWFINNYRGSYHVQHGGHVDGFLANVDIFPGNELGIVVLTNQDDFAIPFVIRNTIADFMLDLEKKDWLQRYIDIKEKNNQPENDTASEDNSSIVTKKPTHPLSDYTGNYFFEGYGNINVHINNDSLYATMDKTKVWLNWKEQDVFTPYLVKDGEIDFEHFFKEMPFSFVRNSDGEISLLNINFEWMITTPVEFRRLLIEKR